MSRPDPERVWLGFAQAALSGLTSIDAVVDHPTSRGWDDVNRSMADDAATLADEMLARWRRRYESDKPDVTKPVDTPDF